MKVPDKIYIAETPNKLIEIWSDETIESKPYIKEHEYIRKNALMEWAKKEMGELSSESNTAQGVKMGLTLVLDKIESL